MAPAFFLRCGIKRHLLFVLALATAFAPRSVRAQELTDKLLEEALGINLSSKSSESGPEGVIPFLNGFNASVTSISQHDSSSGWSSVATPDLAYRFSRHFSADVSAPIYTYITTYENVGTRSRPLYEYTRKSGVIGDTFLSFHVDVMPRNFGYDATFSLGVPSGHSSYGVGAGQVTYNFSNFVQRSFGLLNPTIEIGYGNTSTLVDQRIRKDYISVGPLAHFQSGVGVDLPRGMWFEADAYEQLPLSQDLIYSTTIKGKKKVTTVKNVGIAEDNGFLNSLDIPVTPHVTLSGFYNRSLRDHSDVAGFSLTLFLKRSRRGASLLR